VRGVSADHPPPNTPCHSVSELRYACRGMAACPLASLQQQSLSRTSSVASIPSTADSEIYEWRPETRQLTPTQPSWEVTAAVAQADPVVQFAHLGWVMPTAMTSGSWQSLNGYNNALGGSWLPAALAVGSEAAEVTMAQSAAPMLGHGMSRVTGGLGADSWSSNPSWQERNRRKSSGSSLESVKAVRSDSAATRGDDSPSRRRGSTSSSSETPTVDELRALQRRLAEVTAKPSDKTSHHKRVQSNSSLSTMASESEDLTPWATPSLRHALSSGSVSSLVSEMLEDAQVEEGTEFGPIFEEDLQVAAGESNDVDGAIEELAKTQQDNELRMQTEQRQTPVEQQRSDQPREQSGRAMVMKESRFPNDTDKFDKEFSHSRVPKNFNLAEEFSRSNHEDPPTTMMIRNIPNRYTQRELIRELEGLGFAGSFDFLYVPIDKATMCNVGYAFVNFVDHSWALRCMQTFDGYPFKKFRKARGKIASVSVAHIQGLEANLRHYENSAVNGAVRSRQQRSPMLMTSTTATNLKL